jgi:hypothetical protein
MCVPRLSFKRILFAENSVIFALFCVVLSPNLN